LVRDPLYQSTIRDPRHPQSFPTRRSSDLQDLEAYSNLDPKTKYPARIQLIGSVLDENGLADVQCQFINSNMNLVPGTYMNVDIADRKSTRLNSSHVKISYAVFCLKKKNKE